jgi:hypothetical protein
MRGHQSFWAAFFNERSAERGLVRDPAAAHFFGGDYARRKKVKGLPPRAVDYFGDAVCAPNQSKFSICGFLSHMA